ERDEGDVAARVRLYSHPPGDGIRDPRPRGVAARVDGLLVRAEMDQPTLRTAVVAQVEKRRVVALPSLQHNPTAAAVRGTSDVPARHHLRRAAVEADAHEVHVRRDRLKQQRAPVTRPAGPDGAELRRRHGARATIGERLDVDAKLAGSFAV